MLDDQKEMHADQAGQDGRKHPDVGGEEALQRERAQVRSAAQGFEDEVADEGNRACDLRADRGRPVGRLVPGEQVAREAHANGRQQKTDADQPGQLARIFVGGGHKHPQHMDEDDDHHQRCAPVMDAADQPAEGNAFHDVLDGVVGMIGGGSVINGQENPGHPLQNKKEQTRRAECVPPVALGFGAVKQIFVDIVQAKSFIQPVENFFPH